MDADVPRLIDREEIADLSVLCTFALDTKDWPLFDSCFTGTAVFVHLGGRPGGLKAILDRSRVALAPLDASQHLLGNVVDDGAGIGGGPVRRERPAAARDGGRDTGDRHPAGAGGCRVPTSLPSPV
jgi:SnoaL-like protein